MMLDVPFIPDDDYEDFLERCTDQIFSLYFSLYAEDVLDARYKLSMVDMSRLKAGLVHLKKPRKYALFNSRFYFPDGYNDQKRLFRILSLLADLRSASVLDGIVFSDLYLLYALSDTGHDVISELEAVPSINCMIDSVDRAGIYMDAIGRTRFKRPAKLTADRSLNRRLDDLSTFSARIARLWPGTGISLIANEGCIYECPYKLTHDAHIAAINTGTNLDTHHLNRQYGCRRYFWETPHRVLKSPFIRPEDMARYNPFADMIKICGRTLGPKFLIQTVSAYLNGSFKANLLSLMDTLEWMAEFYYLDNSKLADDFFETVTTCSKQCDTCDKCQTMWHQSAHRIPFQFKDLTRSRR